MDNNKIDRLHAANEAFSDRFNKHDVPQPIDTSSGSVETNEENVNASDFIKHKYELDKPLVGNIMLSEVFEQVKTKRSQGRNQVANSLKLYDRRTKQYISIAMIANIIVDEKNSTSEEIMPASRVQLNNIQILFDEFLLNVHELL